MWEEKKEGVLDDQTRTSPCEDEVVRILQVHSVAERQTILSCNNYCFVALAMTLKLRAFFLASQGLVDHVVRNAGVVIEFHRIGRAALGQ